MIKLFESYSFPDSLIGPSRKISNLLNREILLWVEDKIHYSKIFIIDCELNEDYPLRNIRIKLNLSSKYDDNYDYDAIAYHFIKSQFVKEREDSLLLDDGTISPMIEFSFKIGDIDPMVLKEEIDIIVRHEILHTYQSYRKFLKGHPISLDSHISKAIMEISNKYTESDDFSMLMDVYYYIATKSEISAFVAELTNKSNNYILNDMKDILNSSRSECIDIIRSDMDLNYPDIDLDEIPSEFVDAYQHDSQMDKDIPFKRVMKMKNLSFDEFIGKVYDDISSKMRIIKSKLGKINSR